MKKFKFTLQTVHNVRELRKEQESVTLTELRADADQAKARVRDIETIRDNAIDEYTLRLRSGQVSVIEMELNSNHFATLNRLQQEAEKLAAERLTACDEQIEIVASAMREVKVTDRLRQTQKAFHQKTIDSHEQNNVDEIISARYARQILQTK